MRRIAACVLTALLGVTAVVRLHAESPFHLTVRLYNSAGIPASSLVAARHAAEPIFDSTGMEVTFRLCGRAGEPGGLVDPCDDSLKPSEVVVRVIDAPAFNPVLDPQAFGMTYVVENTGRGWLATVFADRIAHAASRANLAPGALLGRVLAHEIGHLLLGQGYHGDAGLMRAEWNDELLHRDRPDEWRFSLNEVAVMQQRLLSTPAP